MADLVLLQREAGIAHLADKYGATGIAVVPVMLERMMELPVRELEKYTLDALRLVTARG